MRSVAATMLVGLGLCACKAGGTAAPPVNGAPGIDMGGCDRNAVIDDSEDNDHRTVVHGGRGGYVYTFLDEAGSTVEPTAGRLGGTFSQAEGGANGSMYAARFKGELADGNLVFAGFGVNFSDPKAPYDASAFEGISFFARRSADSVGNVRLKVPDASTDPEGGKCTECFNDFGTDLELEDEWQQYKLQFSDLSQASGWGAPRPGSIDAGALFGIQWQVNSAGAQFDIWVDDVAFYGCKR